MKLQLMLAAALVMGALSLGGDEGEVMVVRASSPLGGATRLSGQLTGRVEEVLEVRRYSYLRLRLDGGSERWVAVPGLGHTVGEQIEVAQLAERQDFRSSTGRSFPRLVFGLALGRRSLTAAP